MPMQNKIIIIIVINGCVQTKGRLVILPSVHCLNFNITLHTLVCLSCLMLSLLHWYLIVVILIDFKLSMVIPHFPCSPVTDLFSDPELSPTIASYFQFPLMKMTVLNNKGKLHLGNGWPAL